MKTVLFLAVCLVGSVLSLEKSTNTLYPYGDNTLDEWKEINVGDGDEGSELPLKTEILFGTYYESMLYISAHGAVSFNADQPYPKSESEICGMNNDTVMFRGLMPYLEKTDHVKIYMRETSDVELCQRAAQEIVNAFPAWEGLQIASLVVVTWENEKDKKCDKTFQLVLATDTVFSFALYNYDKDLEKCQSPSMTVRIGYDNGQGHVHELPMSCSPDANKVAVSTNVNRPGSYIFHIDLAGLSYLSWLYYFYVTMGSFWLWCSVFLSFVLGMLSTLCCLVCCSCCSDSFKKKNNTRTIHITNNNHGTPEIIAIAPPEYTDYPEDLIPPKY